MTGVGCPSCGCPPGETLCSFCRWAARVAAALVPEGDNKGDEGVVTG